MKSKAFTLKKRRGLSEVVSTLMLVTFGMMFAVILAGFATNVTRSQLKQTTREQLEVSKKHVWMNETSDEGVVAFKLENLGLNEVAIKVIDVAGHEIDWPDVYFYTVPENETVLRDLNQTSYSNLSGETTTVDEREYTMATEGLAMSSKTEIIFYIRGPSNLSADTINQPIIVIFLTAHATVITQIIVEPA